ncbi:MAG TPA: class I SAM-dependent methyltransferase [Gaiellaceae bacterium]|nr:class I SAM-dependent methyltransferase [Gaiellaceae bacterium]
MTGRAIDDDVVVKGVVMRETCRICGSSPLSPIIDLGDQCIAGAFRPPGADAMPEPKLPLQLVRCDSGADPRACGLVQLRHTVPAASLYEAYWYRSGINRSMTENLHEIAAQAAEEVGGLRTGDLVVDIGCNDGTLLDGYGDASSEIALLGVDPSDVTRYAVAKGYDVINEFFSARHVAERFGTRKARVITSIAMFYDLEQPGEFVDDIAGCLDEDGLWVSEFSYMPTMLEKSSFDTICHEHLEYYSLAVIERLFGDHGLEVVRAELNDVNGGSIRLFARHAGRGARDAQHERRLKLLRDRESELELATAKPYDAFARSALALRDELRALLTTLREAGSRIHVYGASTKGNTILQFAGIDRAVIEYAADRNPDKWGSETIGTHIPILSEEDSRARLPDYYLVLPWHFLDEFMEREADYLASGGQFIVPLPEVRVIGRPNSH